MAVLLMTALQDFIGICHSDYGPGGVARTVGVFSWCWAVAAVFLGRAVIETPALLRYHFSTDHVFKRLSLTYDVRHAFVDQNFAGQRF